ncbi:hypothetical protein GTP45_01095 [Pseudoduganella sp. FT55W]|uniref:Uncharacterized protein n=1 Tax=Duganella rivi TaxID=2666083 RepID=A0A7X4GL14_9BURK|nr:hypothetical protein [Duganella rivi]MYM65428.1 hypothetical protein [Duganella rivi]
MNVIPPISITDAILTSSPVPEGVPTAYATGTTYAAGALVSVTGANGAFDCFASKKGGNVGNAPASSPAWWVFAGTTYNVYAAGATYALGWRVIDPASHQVYQSLMSGNVGNPLSDGEKWFLVGATNRWAMFDLLRNTRTIFGGTLSVVLTPVKRVSAIALLGLAATSVAVTVEVAGVVAYSKTVNLIRRDVRKWSEYLRRGFRTKESLALFDLPPYSNATITVAISNAFGNTECGSCVVGMAEYLGGVRYSAESDVLNFSKVKRDDDGNSELQPKPNIPKANLIVETDKSLIERLRQIRRDLDAKPVVWSGLDDSDHEYFEALLILGIYKRFAINLEKTITVTTLELEEV